jgi:hypothetical protein
MEGEDGRRSADGQRVRKGQQAQGPARQHGPTREPDRLLAGERGLRHHHRDGLRAGLPVLGLARPVPGQRDPRARRPVRPPQHLRFFGLLDLRETGAILAAAFVALFLLAAMWAPLAAHLPRMFPVEVRFTGAGLGFQAAGILGGALAPTICVMLLKDYGSALPVSLYLGSTLVLALLCILLTPAASKR